MKIMDYFSPKNRRALIIVFCLAAAIRLISWHFNLHLVRDSVLYIQLVNEWCEYGTARFFSEFFKDYAWLPILPIALMRLFCVTGIPVEISCRLCCLLMGIGVPILGYLIVYEISHNRKLALFTGCFMAVNHHLVEYSIMPLRDGPYLFFAGVVILCFFRGAERRKFSAFAAAFCFIFIALMCRYEAMELFLLLIVGLIMCRKKIKVDLKKILLPLLIFCVLTIGVLTVKIVCDMISQAGAFSTLKRLEYYINLLANIRGFFTNFCELLFKRITRGLGEIFAVGTVIATAFILFKRKHHSPYYKFIWFSILFMLLWRIMVAIVTGRYASLLIYPASAFTAYVAVRGEAYLRLLAAKLPDYRKKIFKFSKVFPFLVLFGVIGGSIWICFHNIEKKSFHWDFYEIVAKEKAASSALTVYVRAEEKKRTIYYTGHECFDIPLDDQKLAKNIILGFADADSTLLIYIQESVKRDSLTISKDELPAGAEFELIYSEFVNKKKRKKNNIYRYRPPVNILPCSAEPDKNGNILANNGFEEARSHADSLRWLPESCKTKPFFSDDNFKLPALYGFAVPQAAEKNAELSLTTINPLAGKYSLQIKNPAAANIVARHSHRFPPGQYRFSMLLRGSCGSQVTVKAMIVDKEGRISLKNCASAKLSDETPVRLNAVFKIPAGIKYFSPEINVVGGKVILDDIIMQHLTE